MAVDEYKHSPWSPTLTDLKPDIPEEDEDSNHLGVLDASAGGEGATEDPSPCAVRVNAKRNSSG